MKYTYTAVLTPGVNGKYYARVPDLPGCITTGRTLAEAVELITDAAGGWLVTAEDEGMPIAPPTEQKDIPRPPDAVLSVVAVDTIQYRAETDDSAVDRAVSLPAWMAAMADRHHINCSQVLQDALRGMLGA